MKAKERVVKFFDCKVSAKGWSKETGSVALVAHSLESLLLEMKAALDRGAFLRESHSKTQTWHIAKIELVKGGRTATVLINRSDRSAANQAYSNPRAKRFQVQAKDDGDGNAYSAHVVFKLAPVHKDRYLTVIEQADGISSANIARVLTMALRSCSRDGGALFKQKDPGNGMKNGKPVMMKARYKLLLVGHPSASFEEELNAGKLSDIEVIDDGAANQLWDDKKTAAVRGKVIRLGPTVAGKWAPWEIVSSVGQSAKKRKFKNLRVTFVDADKFTRSVLLDTDDMTIVNEDRFVRKERLADFEKPIDTGSEVIHPELNERMIRLLG